MSVSARLVYILKLAYTNLLIATDKKKLASLLLELPMGYIDIVVYFNITSETVLPIGNNTTKTFAT